MYANEPIRWCSSQGNYLCEKVMSLYTALPYNTVFWKPPFFLEYLNLARNKATSFFPLHFLLLLFTFVCLFVDVQLKRNKRKSCYNTTTEQLNQWFHCKSLFIIQGIIPFFSLKCYKYLMRTNINYTRFFGNSEEVKRHRIDEGEAEVVP